MTTVNQKLTSNTNIVEFEKFLNTIKITQTWYGGRRVVSTDHTIKGALRFKDLTLFAMQKDYKNRTIGARLKELNDAGNQLYKSNCFLLILRALGRLLARFFGNCCHDIDHHKDIAKIALGGENAYKQWNINSLPVDLRPENHAAIRQKLAELPKNGRSCRYLSLLYRPQGPIAPINDIQTLKELHNNQFMRFQHDPIDSDHWIIYGYAFISGYIPSDQPWKLGFQCFNAAKHEIYEKILKAYIPHYSIRGENGVMLYNSCKSARAALPTEGLHALWHAFCLDRLFEDVKKYQEIEQMLPMCVNHASKIHYCFMEEPDGSLSIPPYVKEALIKLFQDLEKNSKTPSYLLTGLYHEMGTRLARTKEGMRANPGELSEETIDYLLKSLGTTITDEPNVQYLKIEKKLTSLASERDFRLYHFICSFSLLVKHYKINNNHNAIVKIASMLFEKSIPYESYPKITALEILREVLPIAEFNQFVLTHHLTMVRLGEFHHQYSKTGGPIDWFVTALVARFELEGNLKDLEQVESILKKITQRRPIGKWNSVDEAANAIAAMIKAAQAVAPADPIPPTENILGHAW